LHRWQTDFNDNCDFGPKREPNHRISGAVEILMTTIAVRTDKEAVYLEVEAGFLFDAIESNASVLEVIFNVDKISPTLFGKDEVGRVLSDIEKLMFAVEKGKIDEIRHIYRFIKTHFNNVEFISFNPYG
jgi:hypothetical protein